MNFLTVLGLATGLAMDAFAVAIVVGATLPRLTFRHYFRLSFHFGLFQFLMPILGWFLGSQINFELSAYDHWIAFLLLLVLGTKMIYESTTGREELSKSRGIHDPTRKWSLISLSIATSIDALAVGLSVALLDVEIILPSIIIGLVALLFTLVGMRFGLQVGRWIGKAACVLGGLILIAIGVRILVAHLST